MQWALPLKEPAMLDIYKLADAYEMPSDKIDGMTAEAVHEGVARAVKRAREGDGPTLLEMKTYRYKIGRAHV